MASSSATRRARHGEKSEPPVDSPGANPPSLLSRFSGSTLAWGLAGAAMLWVALPPLNLWPLAWVAPIPWLHLVRRPELPGRRPYRQLWLAGFVFWLAAVWWLTLPHWTTALLWPLLAFYLAFYLPVFVGLTRVAFHRLAIPLPLAAPVVWAGLELARAHLLSGFLMAALGHTQYRWIALVQVSDLGGAYAVSFIVMCAAACLEAMWPREGRRIAIVPLTALAALLASTLVYGYWRLSSPASRPGPKVALIQGSIDSQIKHDPTQADRIFEHYAQLTWKALDAQPNVDLVVWPETMFPWPRITAEPGALSPPSTSLSPDQLVEKYRAVLASEIGRFRKPFLLGISTLHLTPTGEKRFNSVLSVDARGIAGERYDKMHRVVFGEYVPLADAFPWLYRLSPLPHGLEPGRGPVALSVGAARYAPSICYENTVPHVIRRHVAELAAADRPPHVLVNLTNDGWFWGSSELEMHLACGVFRAVECRRPMLIAANTGISAWIDSDGRVRQQGPRRATDVIIAQPELDERSSLYVAWGDWPAGVCLAACVGLACVGLGGLKGSGVVFRRKTSIEAPPA
jgi:apolipoprotein N-acyltransferase